MRKILSELKYDIGRLNKPEKITSILISYIIDPGFFATTNHRIINRLYKKGWAAKFFAKLLWRINTAITSCHIHPSAEIGRGLHLPHPTAIVIGAGVTMGEMCTIYQSVTLGTNNPKKYNYPNIGNNVTIYASAIITGKIKIEKNCIIGAHCLISSDIPENSIVRPKREHDERAIHG